MPRQYTTTPAPERFWSHVLFSDTCWFWKATLNGRGYGSFKPEYGEASLAHRWAYEFCVGPIPPGLTLDHTCHNRDATCWAGTSCIHRRCVRPDHLQVAELAENIRRGMARKTHCKHGHPYDEANTYRRPDGNRDCRACKAGGVRRFHERRRARLANV